MSGSFGFGASGASPPEYLVEQLPPRLREKIHVNEETGCWEWTGYRHFGYGMVELGGSKHHRVHRVVYQFLVGQIPKGLNVLHHCDVRHCCRPEHLWLGTQKDNVHDAMTKGRFRGRALIFHTSDVHQAVRDALRAYRAVNRDKIRTQQRANYLANRDAILKKSYAYRAAHRDEIRARKRAYYAAANAARATQ